MANHARIYLGGGPGAGAILTERGTSLVSNRCTNGATLRYSIVGLRVTTTRTDAPEPRIRSTVPATKRSSFVSPSITTTVFLSSATALNNKCSTPRLMVTPWKVVLPALSSWRRSVFGERSHHAIPAMTARQRTAAARPIATICKTILMFVSECSTSATEVTHRCRRERRGGGWLDRFCQADVSAS